MRWVVALSAGLLTAVLGASWLAVARTPEPVSSSVTVTVGPTRTETKTVIWEYTVTPGRNGF